jgi:hypothetical protein
MVQRIAVQPGTRAGYRWRRAEGSASGAGPGVFEHRRAAIGLDTNV